LEDALFGGDRSVSKYRFLVILALTLIILILGLGLYIVYQDADSRQRQINDDFNQQQLLLARQAAMQIESSLHDVQVGLERLGRYYPLLGTAADTVDAVNVFVDYARGRGLREIGVIGADGRVTVYYALGREEPPDEEQIRRVREQSLRVPELITQTALAGGGLVSRTITGLLCVPERNHTSGPVLYARLDITELVGRISREIQSGENGQAWVLDGRGTFLYHPRPEFLARNAFVVRSEYSPKADFQVIDSIMRWEMMAGKRGAGEYRSAARSPATGTIGKLIAYTPITSRLLPNDDRWSVAVSAPVDEVAAAVSRATGRYVAIETTIITTMFLLGFLAVFYERRISRSLSRRVAEQEKYLSSIMQYSVDGIVLIDNENRVLVWNRGAELTYGYTEKEMVGRTFRTIIPPEVDADEELRNISEELQREGFIRNYRAQRITKDGRRIVIDLSRTLIRSREGEPIGSVAIMKDVTEEMEMEQRLYNTEKLASIGTLAAGVAHEINNPVAVILGFTDLLKEKFPKGSTELEDLHVIEQNAEAARQTVENLLGFARVQEGEHDTTDVIPCLHTVMKIITSTLLTEKIEFRTDLPDHLPPIRSDAREFQQVIFNLVNNAIAAMKDLESGVLTLSAWVESGRVCVRVTDTGPGIADQIKGRVFDPFFTTKKVGEGTGLGLSLCYGIVKKYGGSIDFFSHSAEDSPTDPAGTSFTVAIPIDKTQDVESGEET